MPALAKYGEDRKAYAVSGNRDIQHRVTCRFVASGSGSFYARSCDMLAQWAEAWTDAEGKQHIGEYPQLRCHRHRAIDERTAANRGYGKRDYAAFDAVKVAADREATLAAAAEFDRLGKVHEQVEASARYILKHAVLATDERRSLEQVMSDLKKGTLEVR